MMREDIENSRTIRNEDRRIRKTKHAIQNSLYMLLYKKDLREIRVKELAECADITRGTLYRYYRDVGDILTESEQDFLKAVQDIFDRCDKGLQTPDRHLFEELFELCRTHAELLELIFSKERDPDFIISLWRLIRKKLMKDWEKEYGSDEEEAESSSGFLAGGCIAILKEWIAKGWSQPTEEIARKTERCLFLLVPKKISSHEQMSI